MGSLRKLKRSVAKHKMEQKGIVQPNKHKYPYMDNDGKSTVVSRQSFFSRHWREA